jgi:hypothetical protein
VGDTDNSTDEETGFAVVCDAAVLGSPGKDDLADEAKPEAADSETRIHR